MAVFAVASVCLSKVDCWAPRLTQAWWSRPWSACHCWRRHSHLLIAFLVPGLNGSAPLPQDAIFTLQMWWVSYAHLPPLSYLETTSLGNTLFLNFWDTNRFMSQVFQEKVLSLLCGNFTLNWKVTMLSVVFILTGKGKSTDLLECERGISVSEALNAKKGQKDWFDGKSILVFILISIR